MSVFFSFFFFNLKNIKYRLIVGKIVGKLLTIDIVC